VSVELASYWSRTLRTFVGCHVTVTRRDPDHPQGGTVQQLHGVLEALGVNHLRLSGGVEVRYDAVLSCEL
jgi:hypothetical protein